MVFVLLAQFNAIARGNVRSRADEEIIHRMEGRAGVERHLGHGHLLD